MGGQGKEGEQSKAESKKQSTKYSQKTNFYRSCGKADMPCDCMPIARSGRPQSEPKSERVHMCLPPLRLQLLVANPISRAIARTGNPGRGGGAHRHDHNTMVCWRKTRDNKNLQKLSPPCVLSRDDMFLGGGTWSIDKGATCGRLHLGPGRDKGRRNEWRCSRGGAAVLVT